LQAVLSTVAGLEQTPVPGLQVPATWHWSSGLHVTGFAPVQIPAWQVSVRVQALPSLQPVLSAVAGLEQTPVPGLQVPATWHWSSGLHVTGFPPVQTPVWQVSVSVQALPSSQPVPFATLTWTQPVDELQLSVVHGLPSSHEIAALEQEPPEQVPAATWHLSVVVHAMPLLATQLPVALQTWHAPQLLTVQQKPSVQLPLLHWSLAEQLAPRSSWLTHDPMGNSWQKLPPEQSPSPAHVVRQPVVPLHMYGAQLEVADVSHEPLAHMPGFWSVDDMLGHEAGAHVVPFGYFWQPPAPSHLPFVPQFGARLSTQMPLGSTVPGATAKHVPACPLTLQAWQEPQLALPQHTLSTQWSVPGHCLSAVHGSP
jgi:hypothetical protein